MARITSLTAVDSFLCEDDQWQHGTRQRTVLNDEQLSVLIDATPYTTVDRVRGHDVELIHGMLRQQGVIVSAQQVSQACYCAGSVAGVNPYNRMDIDIIPVEDSPEPVQTSTLRCTPEQIQSAYRRLLEQAGLRRKTAATHAAGIFGSDGAEIVVRECLTAHQAGWKVLGMAMMFEDHDNAVILPPQGLSTPPWSILLGCVVVALWFRRRLRLLPQLPTPTVQASRSLEHWVMLPSSSTQEL